MLQRLVRLCREHKDLVLLFTAHSYGAYVNTELHVCLTWFPRSCRPRQIPAATVTVAMLQRLGRLCREHKDLVLYYTEDGVLSILVDVESCQAWAAGHRQGRCTFLGQRRPRCYR